MIGHLHRTAAAALVACAAALYGPLVVQAAARQTTLLAVQPLRQVNPLWLAAIGAVVVAALLLLLYVYRKRLYIFEWSVGWLLLAAALLIIGRGYSSDRAVHIATGVSQFLIVTSALVFVVSADSYRHKPRIRRAYLFVLLPLLIWFALAPAALGERAVLVPGSLISAGVLTAAGLAYLSLLKQTQMLGAGLIGVMFLLIAATALWGAVDAISGPGADPWISTRWIFVLGLFYTVAALGMHLMVAEDMTYELRLANRRLEQAQAELRQLAITDSLTGCRNRHFFDEVITRELRRHTRYTVPLSLMFVDIDRFKAVNDLLGHEIGDRVLRSVARFLMRNVRDADYVFRWGGDEFLVLISCSEIEALKKAIELQTLFDGGPESASVPAQISLSIGCAEVPPGTLDVMPLVRAADERMYVDKGRPKATTVRH